MNNKDKLIEYFKSGIKNSKDFKLGLELEHFVVCKNSQETVSFYANNGVEEVLKKISKYYDDMVYSEGHLVGLKRKNMIITLEPAGQLEVSIGEFSGVHDFEIEYNRFLNEINPVLDEMELNLAAMGYHPVSKAIDMPLVPKERYRIMNEHFKSTGTRGINMMRGTCATQISIDYYSEDDFKNKFRLANILTPVLTYLTHNTPVFEGVENSNFARKMIWDSVDNARSGFVPNSLNVDFGFKEYADYILSAPPILIPKENGELEYTAFKALSEIYALKSMNEGEIENALSMFFPYVRLKKYIEIRMMDSIPFEKVVGILSLIKNLFYDEKNVEILLKRFEDVTQKDAENAFDELEKNVETSTIYGENASKLVRDLLTLSNN
ncbi:MAG: glutamate-cysteine ligase family protein [Firmicutes bacterium]|nr:glutamate-cysteine ligase family protein [Bacillota bacterium]